jgi:phosphomethylpyrimidine synthase
LCEAQRIRHHRQDVRKFAAEQQITEAEAVRTGLEQKAKEFAEKGSEVYSKA